MIKTGYKTTEFWLTLLTKGLIVLVALGVINDGEAETLTQAAAIIAALIGLAMNSGAYAKARALVKSTNIKS